MNLTKKKTFTLDQFIKYVSGTAYTIKGITLRKNSERVRLVDGTSVSVQAGAYLYSTPRKDFAQFTHVEVGYPNFEPPKSWESYAEDTLDYKDTIYPYLPIGLVLDYINSVGIK